jgi:hypothetical protein
MADDTSRSPLLTSAAFSAAHFYGEMPSSATELVHRAAIVQFAGRSV